MVGSSEASTWMLITTTNISTGFVGKGKVQETMANFTPLPMGLVSLLIVTTSLFWELVAIAIAYTCKICWKIMIGTSTSLLISQSYL
jgi:hypothetical protein